MICGLASWISVGNDEAQFDLVSPKPSIVLRETTTSPVAPARR